MRVRLKTLMAGPEGVFPAGSVANVPREEAEALIAGGFAERFDQPESPAEADQVPTESWRRG